MGYQGFGYTIYIGDIAFYFMQPAFEGRRAYCHGMLDALRGTSAKNLADREYMEGHGDGSKLFDYGGGKKAQMKHMAFETRRKFRYKHATAELLKRGPKVCAKCGSTQNITVDHIKPVSKGGGNEIDNLQFLCWPCNHRKGNR